MTSLVLTDAAGHELPTPPPPLEKIEAEAIAYFHAFCLRHRLVVAYRCWRCFLAKREDGCNQAGELVVTPRSVRITCRCGPREYVAPVGTGDLATRLANSAAVPTDLTSSTFTFEDGERVERPTVILSAEEAGIVRFYHRVMKALELTPGIVHRPCWTGRVTDDAMMRVSVDDQMIRLLCACRFWFYQGATFRI